MGWCVGLCWRKQELHSGDRSVQSRWHMADNGARWASRVIRAVPGTRRLETPRRHGVLGERARLDTQHCVRWNNSGTRRDRQRHRQHRQVTYHSSLIILWCSRPPTGLRVPQTGQNYFCYTTCIPVCELEAIVEVRSLCDQEWEWSVTIACFRCTDRRGLTTDLSEIVMHWL